MNDSLLCPNTGIAAASRSHFMAGMATKDAARKLIEAMKKPDGTYRNYDEMVAEGIPTKHIGSYDTTGTGIGLNPNTGEADPVQTVTYGVFLAEVEVDKKTGKTRVTRVVVVADVGVVGNYLSVEGQAYGGISHTVGFALTENYDDLRKHASLAGAGIPTIQDVPDDMEVIFHEREREFGPHGSTGCSELFQSGGHMAIINAVSAATGARVRALPASPDKIRAAIDRKLSGEDESLERWPLGPDMYDVLEDIRNNPV
jgi:aldehyde oxidoreductase